jgi:DNA-binding GntR family transcriptional regulator
MLALEHGDPLIDELTRTIVRQQQSARAGDFAKFILADDDFHQQLYAGADRRELWTLVKSRSGHIDRLRRLHLPSPGKAQDIVRHHRLIVAAIDANEPDTAQRHLRNHLSGTLRYLTEIRARFPEYLSD